MLLREFWTNRFWPYCTRNLRESTWVGYESAWRLHVMPVFGGMDMSAISVELVDKWLACFDSAGAARKAWAVLRAILRRGYPLEPCWTWTSPDATSNCRPNLITSREY